MSRMDDYLKFTGKSYFVESSNVSNALDNSTLGIIAEQSTDEDSRLILKGVLCTVLDEVNINGRIYTTPVMQDAIDYAKECNSFENRRFLCAADDHPVTDFVPPSRASHIVTDAYIKEIDGKNYLLADILVLKTSNGKDLEELVKSGASIGTSIRGFGNFDSASKEVRDYEFVGFDFVGDPSAGTFSRMSHSIKTESVKADDKIRVLESSDSENNTTSTDVEDIPTPDEEKEFLVNSATDSSKETDTKNGENKMDLELELLKLEQRSKGKQLSESTLNELVTLKNKCVLEHKMDPAVVESNEVYARMYKECVSAIRSSGVAKVEEQLAESKDLCNKSKSMLRHVMEQTSKELVEARNLAKKAVAERRDAMAKLRKLQRESVTVDAADRHLAHECRKVARAANKEMRIAVSHCKLMEQRLNARSIVMKVMKNAK